MRGLVSPVAGMELEEGLVIENNFLRGATPYTPQNKNEICATSNSTTNSLPVTKMYAQET